MNTPGGGRRAQEMESLGFKVSLSAWIKGLGFRVSGLGFRVRDALNPKNVPTTEVESSN